MNIELEKYPLPKSENQTYICTNDGEEFFIAGHIEVGKLANPELKGKSGAYAWLEESPYYGQESCYNGTFNLHKKRAT